MNGFKWGVQECLKQCDKGNQNCSECYALDCCDNTNPVKSELAALRRIKAAAEAWRDDADKRGVGHIDIGKLVTIVCEEILAGRGPTEGK